MWDVWELWLVLLKVCFEFHQRHWKEQAGFVAAAVWLKSAEPVSLKDTD